MKKKKCLSTIWLDFLNYIFMPFNILTVSLTLIENINFSNLKLTLFIVFYFISLLISIISFYKCVRRNKLGYYLLYVYIIISLITNGIEIINRLGINDMVYILIFFISGVILWIIPNYIYIKKRKSIFQKHQLLNIKKCPGCERIIPVTMKFCGKCEYKGE